MDEMEYMGFDEDVKEETNVVPIEAGTKKRAPYAVWDVAGTEYKLKLTASVIVKLEQRYKRNLLLMVTEDGLPPVSVMLTVFQAAMQLHHHGITYSQVQDAYDKYVDNGGDQQSLMADVMLPLLAVSGFFTQTQATLMAKELKDLDTSI